MSIFTQHPKDHVAKWFEQRRKLGIGDALCWGRYTPETGILKMQEFHHANGDAMSVMKHLLNETGHADIPIPLCKEQCEPTRKRLKAIKKQRKPYSKKVKWLFWKPDQEGVKKSVETLFFNKQETAKIEQYAKTLNVPLTALVLWAANSAASKHLLQPKQAYTWFYPVNLRGAVEYGTGYGNYSSGFYLPMHNHSSAEQIHHGVREKLKSGEHWLSWQEAKIAHYLPAILIRWIYRLISKKQFYAGNFSTMGRWFSDGDDVTTSSDDLTKERWFCCAPGTKNYPISSYMMIWNDQLSLTLKLHPAIVKNEKVTTETLCTWGSMLLASSSIQAEAAVQEKRIIVYHPD